MKTDLDSEVLEALDFDANLPCEFSDNCAGEARWKVVTKCCGATLIGCNACFMFLMEIITTNPKATGECVPCSTRVVLSDWLARVERIKT